jgi:hypothetical protein
VTNYFCLIYSQATLAVNQISFINIEKIQEASLEQCKLYIIPQALVAAAEDSVCTAYLMRSGILEMVLMKSFII